MPFPCQSYGALAVFFSFGLHLDAELHNAYHVTVDYAQEEEEDSRTQARGRRRYTHFGTRT